MVIYQMIIKDDFTFFWQECSIPSRGIRIRIQTFWKCWIRIRFREPATLHNTCSITVPTVYISNCWSNALTSFIMNSLCLQWGKSYGFLPSDIVPDWGEKVDLKLTMVPYSRDCGTGPSAYIGWRAGTTTLCHGRLYPPVREYDFGKLTYFPLILSTKTHVIFVTCSIK